MYGWWDCPSLDDFFYRVLKADLDRKAGIFLPQLLGTAMAYLANLQSVGRAFEVGKRHYDLDEDLFRSMLGSNMTYSSGYCGGGATTLDEAQFAKHDLICRKLHPDGLFLLHTIGGLHTEIAGDSWMSTHIFPNGKLPSLRQITTEVEDRFVIEDLHNFGADYDFTLTSWSKNFQAAIQRSELTKQFDERFQRIWQYYLLSCAGAFRSRNLQLWQFVLSPSGVPGGYRPAR